MRHPLITQHQPKSSQIHLNLKVHKALGSIWAELITCSKEFCDSEHVPDEPIDSAVFWYQSRLRVDSKSNTQMPHLSSRSDIKGSPRIDKSYLLRLPCSKPIVMVKTSPINLIATSRLIYTSSILHHLFTPRYGVIPD